MKLTDKERWIFVVNLVSGKSKYNPNWKIFTPNYDFKKYYDIENTYYKCGVKFRDELIPNKLAALKDLLNGT